MISLATSPKQIVLFYNSNQKNHKEIFAYASSAGKDLLAIDVSKDKVAGTTWTEIADVMNLRVRDLIHTDHATFENKYGTDNNIDCDGAIKVLQKDPEMLIFPVAIEGKRAKEIKLYNEILEFFDVDTSSIHIP
ncbi:hypothetical protein [Nonlabens sp. Asnod3-A02]|uniref:hypothetical protein n=1 Tax=Nonlabens sp. Asnod3-A02 TaxID=3160579 RepID=UPI003869361D